MLKLAAIVEAGAIAIWGLFSKTPVAVRWAVLSETSPNAAAARLNTEVELDED